MTILFTVQVETNAGLADKLGKFLNLYRLGRALGYSYVHSPSFESRRSAGLQRKNAGFLKRIMSPASEPSLAEFLGLDLHDELITSEKYANYSSHIVDVNAIFTAQGFRQLSKLKSRIEVAAPDTIYVLRWTGKWSLQVIQRLDRFLNRWCEMDARQAAIEGLELPKKYLLARERWPLSVPFAEDKIRLAIHIRKGDRAVIRLGQRIIAVHASKVDLVREQQLEKLSTRMGQPRSLIEVSEVAGCLRQILSDFGADKFSIIVVSDGYERTFREIRKALQDGRLCLQPDELRQLKNMEVSAPREFDAFQSLPNTTTIVGESRQNLYQSIHAIVSADIVISTVGGFSKLNLWFHPEESVSLVANFKPGCERIRKRIGAALRKLEQQD